MAQNNRGDRARRRNEVDTRPMAVAPQVMARPSLAEFAQPQPGSGPDNAPDMTRPARPGRSRVDDLRRAGTSVPQRAMELAQAADEVEAILRQGRDPDDPNRELQPDQIAQFKEQLTQADQKLGLANPATRPGPAVTPAGPGPQVGAMTAPQQPQDPPTFFRGMSAPPVPQPDNAPDLRRSEPRAPMPPEDSRRNRVIERAGMETRADGAITYGGGAQPNPSAPDMPFERRVPRGPESGQPSRQAARNATAPGSGPAPAQSMPPSIPSASIYEPLAPSMDVSQPQMGSSGLPIQEVDPEASAFMQDWQAARRNGDVFRASSSIADELNRDGSPLARAWGAALDYFTTTPDEGKENAQARRARGEASQWFRTREAVDLFKADPALLDEAVKDPVSFYQRQTGKEPPSSASPQGAAEAAQPPSAQPQTGTGAREAPDGQPAPSQGGVGMPTFAGMTPSQAALYQGLPRPRLALEYGGGEVRPGGGQAAPEYMANARAALAENANADDNGQAPRPSESQLNRGTADFMRFYRENALPKKIEVLMRAGEYESAQRLQAFMDSERSKQIQIDYARAVASASLGDERGFFTHIGRLYNQIDDGYEFIAEQSDLSKNEAGQTIATVALRNTETGEVFVQNYEGGEELIQAVLTRADPANVFVELESEARAAQQSAAEQQQWEIGEARRRISEGWDNEQDRRMVAQDIWSELTKNDPMFASLSADEKVVRVQEEMQALRILQRGSTGASPAPTYTGQ